MIKITKEISNLLSETGNVGIFCDFGAVIGNAEFVIFYKDDSNDVYLAHISEFEQDGIYIKPKDNLYECNI
jgi:hypothetical protein